MKVSIQFAVLLLVLLMGCSGAQKVAAPNHTVVSSQAQSAPYYRFFRGEKLAKLGDKKYLARLSKDFLPVLPALYGSNILRAYMPAVPPTGMKVEFPDEIALIVYASREIYDQTRATLAGKAYGDLHWQVFDQTQSKRGSTVLYSGHVEQDVAYDVLGRNLDWNAGFTTFFIGEKKPEHSTREFLAWLEKYVARVRIVYGDVLRGYVFVAGADYEIAYMNWESEAAMNAVFNGEEGKKVSDDAHAWVTPKSWGGLKPFAGVAKRGDAFLMKIRQSHWEAK